MKNLKSGQIEGFMKNLIIYNVSNLTDEFDDHARLVVKKALECLELKKRDYYIIRNGKEIKCKIDYET